VSATVGELVGKLSGSSKALASGKRTALAAAAEVAKVAFESAPGAPHGNVAKKPVKVSVKVLGDTAYVKWSPNARLVNDPTRAHFIVPKKGKGTRANRQRAAAFLSAFGATGGGGGRGGHAIAFGGNVRAWVHHPGTKGKHFAEAGREVAARVVPQTYQRHTRAELGKFFTGG